MAVPLISAYVPCFNNAGTIRVAVESLLAQSVPPAEVLVVDDGSSDAPEEQLRDLDVRVIRLERNNGRGTARARAMAAAGHELVVCCDATNALDPSFIERALPWFDNERVAAVVGRIAQGDALDVVSRWRGRHLFKIDVPQAVRHGTTLCTWGTLVRASAVRAVGGFSPALRHTEDGELGERLRAGAFDIVYDPTLQVRSVARNTLSEVLERYWRWHAGVDEHATWGHYVKAMAYSIKGMAAADLRAGDPLAAAISVLCPHYQFWRSQVRRVRRGRAEARTVTRGGS